MGCGVSRPMTDEQTPPISGRTRPIRRRIVEKKKWRRGTTPLKKEPLPDEDDDAESHISPKSLIHDHIIQKNTENDLSSAQELSSMPGKEKEKENEEEKEKEGKISISEYTIKPLPPPPPPPVAASAPKLTSGEEKTEVVEKKGGEKEKDEENVEEEEDGENDEEENGYGYIDGPGSPSFRDYYVNSVGNSTDLTDTSKEEDANEGAKKEKKSQRNESIASSEGSITQLVKKRSSKGKRFIRALPKGLNVRSCYTPPTSSQDNPPQLLNAKVVHAS